MTTVIEKYGFVPCSVLHFGKTSKLTMGYLQSQKLRREQDKDKCSSSCMSEFNPDLCKFVIQYWSNRGDLILDPFHGWGTRCAIAMQLGRAYMGYDISPTTNKDVAEMIREQTLQTKWFGCEIPAYKLLCGDGTLVSEVQQDSVDLIFTCPPYFNIEKYESVKGQLSDIDDYKVFMQKMATAAKRYIEVLKDKKFCVLVVGDWREKGTLRLFSKDMIDVFCSAGFTLYDLLIHKLNSAAIVGCGNFDENHFVTKSHEYILVFKKSKPAFEQLLNKI